MPLGTVNTGSSCKVVWFDLNKNAWSSIKATDWSLVPSYLASDNMEKAAKELLEELKK